MKPFATITRKGVKTPVFSDEQLAPLRKVIADAEEDLEGADITSTVPAQAIKELIYDLKRALG